MEYPFITITLRFTDPGVVAPDRVLSMDQIEETVCKQMTDVKLGLLYSNTEKHLTMHSSKILINNVYKSYIYLMIIYRGFGIK